MLPIRPHLYWKGTSCPGKKWPAWVPQLRKEVNVSNIVDVKLNGTIVGMACTPEAKGYWLVASDGSVYAFGNAEFYGGMNGKALRKPVVGILATPSGKGYWLYAADGGIFAYGDAPFHGTIRPV